MAQVKLLKITASGKTEHSSGADDITFLSGKFGNVQASANTIVSTDTNGSLSLTPNGTGDLILDGQKWPQADGTTCQILKTNGSGQTSWTDPYAFYNVDTADFVAGVGGTTANDCVYISASGTVLPADASAEATSRAIGFAQNTALVTEAVNVQMNGVLGGFSGLTSGSRYFLSETAGAITSTMPSTAASEVVQVGYGAAATKLLIQFEHIGIRS